MHMSISGYVVNEYKIWFQRERNWDYSIFLKFTGIVVHLCIRPMEFCSDDIVAHIWIQKVDLSMNE